MYQWVVFAHIAGVLAFMLAHGTSVAVAFKLRNERDRARIAALIDLSGSTISAMYVALVLLLGGGITAGFMGKWWSRGWIWASLGILLAVAGVMYPLGSRYFRRIKDATRMRPSGAPQVSDEELAELVGSSRPMLLLVVGAGPFLLILYLMIFKPF